MSYNLNLTPPHESVVGFPPTNGTPPFSLQLIGITYPNPDYHHFRPQDNCDTVIEYVLSGSGFVSTATGVHAVSAGDAFLLHAGERHDYYANPNDPWKKIWVNIDSKIANSILNAYGITDTTVFHGLDISEYINKIHSIAKSDPDNPESVFDRCFIVFIQLCQFLRGHLNPTINSPSVSHNIVKLKNYIDLHLDKDLNLEEFAAITNLSVSQTIRAFSKLYGTTPYKYLSQQRYEAAKTLLRGSQLSILDIAKQLGFSDQYYFSSFFKKKYGKSPMEYRNYK